MFPRYATLATAGGQVCVSVATDDIENVDELQAMIERLCRRPALQLAPQSAGLSDGWQRVAFGSRRDDGKLTVFFPRGAGDRLLRRLESRGVKVSDCRTPPRTLAPSGVDPCGLRHFVRRHPTGVIDCLGHDPSDAKVVRYLVTGGPLAPNPQPGSNKGVVIGKTFVVVSNRPRSSQPDDEVNDHSGQSPLKVSDPSQRLVRSLQNQGVRAADLFAGESAKTWTPQFAEWVTGAFEADEQIDWSAEQWEDAKDTPVVVGTWTMLRHLCDQGASPDLIVVTEPLMALSKPAEDALPYIPSDTRMSAIVRDYDRLPRISRGVIRAAFGRKRLRVGDLGSRPTLPEVVRVMPQRFEKPVKNPQNCRSEAERTRKLTRAVVTHTERNREVVRVALDAVRDPADHASSGLPVEVSRPCGRIAIVAADDQHVAELLRKLPPNWAGLVEDEFDIASVSGAEHIKGRLIRPRDKRKHALRLANGKPQQLKASSFANYIVVSRRRVRAAGHRDVYVQADAASESLKLTMGQISRLGLDEPPLVIDIADAWPPALRKRSRSRRAWLKQVGWFGSATRRRSDKMDGEKVKKIPGGHTVQTVDRRTRLDRATAKIEQYRNLLDAPLLRSVANREILEGMLASLGLPEHGRAAGPDDIRTTDICVSQIGDIAEDITNTLYSGDWQVGGERRVEIPKGTTGESRTLGIPNVDNRAVQKAVAEILQSYMAHPTGTAAEPGARQWRTAAGYCRRGQGQLRMLADLKARFDEGGLPVAVVFDIRKAFDSVRVDDVLRACGSEGHDLRRTEGLSEQAAILEAERQSMFPGDDLGWEEHDAGRPEKPLRGFESWQDEQERFWSLFERLLRGEEDREVGIAQGGPLSPLALELLLDVFLDSPLQAELGTMPAFWFGRYVDDGVLLVPDRESGLLAVQVIEELLVPLGLKMKSLKGSQSRVVDLTAGEETSIVGLELHRSDSGLAYRFPSGVIGAASDSVARLSVAADSFTRVRSFVRSFLFSHAPALSSEPTFVSDLHRRLGASVPETCPFTWFSSVVGDACSQWASLIAE